MQSERKGASYPYNIHATFVPVGISHEANDYYSFQGSHWRYIDHRFFPFPAPWTTY